MKYYYALSSLLFGVSIVLVQSQVALGLSAQEVEQIGKEITVRIVDAQNPSIAGSGVIIKRAGNSYTVLTTYHVVKEATKPQLFISDGQSYQIQSVKRLPKVDLAVVEFSSSKTYRVAKIGNSDKATATTTVYVAGFPGQRGVIPNPTFFFNKGQVNANGTAQKEGYDIFYDNDTLKGMSGGPVLNEQGEVVAVHGQADEQPVSEKGEKYIITGVGITIYSALRQMLAVGVDIGVRPSSLTVAATPKAKEITVQIVDSQNPSFTGSGVIVKKASNTYTVLTASHLFQSGQRNTIITPDKQSYEIKNVKYLQGLDLAAVEFNSNKTYSVAKIGNSDQATSATIIYVAGYPRKSATIVRPEFFFGKGQVLAQGQPDRDGYNIIYSNDTFEGMSGGPLLNEQEELIGIHGRIIEMIGNGKQISSGIGITINTVLQRMQNP